MRSAIRELESQWDTKWKDTLKDTPLASFLYEDAVSKLRESWSKLEFFTNWMKLNPTANLMIPSCSIIILVTQCKHTKHCKVKLLRMLVFYILICNGIKHFPFIFAESIVYDNLLYCIFPDLMLILFQILDFLSPMAPLSFEPVAELGSSVFTQYPATLLGEQFVFPSAPSPPFSYFRLLICPNPPTEEQPAERQQDVLESACPGLKR